MEDLLSMGPPVYFVLTSGLNYTDTRVQNMICGGQGCNADSLYTQIYSASKQPSVFVCTVNGSVREPGNIGNSQSGAVVEENCRKKLPTFRDPARSSDNNLVCISNRKISYAIVYRF